MPKITKIDVIDFEYQLQDVEPEPIVGHPIYSPGATLLTKASAIRIYTDVGLVGEYIGGPSVEYSGIPIIAQSLIGRNPLERENIFNDAKQALRQNARMGLGAIDIALWDFAGKYYEAPLFELLGGTNRKLPCYASTYIGDHHKGGLNSPQAYAEFAQYCLDLGYPGFKIHGWQDVSIDQQIDLVHSVGNKVGEKMDLMLDPFCAIKTFGDAIKLGRACDEEKFFWLEYQFN